MAKGYIKLHRQMTEHWLYADKPFDRAHAWIDLLFLANWKDNIWNFKGQVIEQKRGDVVTSVKALSLRWGWSEGRYGVSSMHSKKTECARKSDYHMAWF